MRVLIASDAFKDALNAADVCRAIGRGIKGHPSVSDTRNFPLADGGEGTSRIITEHLGGDLVKAEVRDPLMRLVDAVYGISPDGKTAYLEMAEASGIQLLTDHERNGEQTSSAGTGDLIRYASQRGVREIIIGIGGSATNDGGMGMASSLGLRFCNAYGQPLTGKGAELMHVDHIAGHIELDPAVTVLCDVRNPLLGPKGATHTFGPQKGASQDMLDHLEAGMQHFANVCDRHFNTDFRDTAGAGAAGGMGYALMTFLGGSLVPGSQSVLELLNFKQAVMWADMIITGEGRLDDQTSAGKLISAVCRIAKTQDKPAIALCGQLQASQATLEDLGLAAAIQISDPCVPLQESLASTEMNLEYHAAQAIREFIDE